METAVNRGHGLFMAYSGLFMAYSPARNSNSRKQP